MSLVFQQSDSFPEKIGLKYLQLYNSIKSHATTSLHPFLCMQLPLTYMYSSASIALQKMDLLQNCSEEEGPAKICTFLITTQAKVSLKMIYSTHYVKRPSSVAAYQVQPYKNKTFGTMSTFLQVLNKQIYRISHYGQSAQRAALQLSF